MTIQSDNGPEFFDQLIKDLSVLIIEKSPYCPRANGAVGRVNSSITSNSIEQCIAGETTFHICRLHGTERLQHSLDLHRSPSCVGEQWTIFRVIAVRKKGVKLASDYRKQFRLNSTMQSILRSRIASWQTRVRWLKIFQKPIEYYQHFLSVLELM